MLLRILIVATAAWLSGGAVAVVSTGVARFGVTPAVWWLVAALAAAAAIRRFFLPALAIVLLLPWLPIPVPSAFLMWNGPLGAWVWLLIAAALVAAAVRRRVPRAVANPRSAPWLAAGCAAVLYLSAAYRVSPQLPAGDEPHYLVITQSLLRDHDLRIENNHQRGDYHEYFQGNLRPDYLQRGRDAQIYSVHAPGLPALVAPAFAVFGYRGVVVFLALLNAAATALAWSAAWRMTGSAAAAWFGWAAVALSEPFFVQAFMVYPDAPSAAIVMVAIATLMAGREASIARLAATGVALAMLPWLHTRAAILAAALGLVLALRQRGSGSMRRVSALAAAPVISAAAWFAFFYTIYGTPDPRAPYGGASQITIASLPRGIVGLLFDQQFGLLTSAPVYLCAAAGMATLFRRTPRFAAELVTALAPYAVAVAAFQMWWAGYTTPARFLVPALLPLAIPMAMWFATSRGIASRVAGLSALALSVLTTFTIVFVDRGALLLNFRDGASRLLTWLSPVVDLTTAVPSLFQNEPGLVLAQSAVWLAAGGAAVAVAALVSPRWPAERVLAGFGVAAAIFAMAASTIVWRTNRATALKPTAATVRLLHTFDADRRQIRLALNPLRVLRSHDLLARLPIVDQTPASGEPLAYFAHPPAGTYAVALMLAHPATGRVTVSLDPSLGSTQTLDLTAPTGTWSTRVAVPVAAPALRVDADPAVRQAVARANVYAVDIPGSAHRIGAGDADHVARYGNALVFLLGGDADVEPGGVWIRGGGSAEFAIVTDDHQPARVLVRTAPIDNHVTFDGDGWHQELALTAGASRVVDVPTVRVRIGAARGARPADFEPGSADRRLLGCWIEVR